MASPIQATGLGSNLDVQGLVSKLMEVEKAPLTKLTQNQAAVTLKIAISFADTASRSLPLTVGAACMRWGDVDTVDDRGEYSHALRRFAFV